MAIRFGSAYQFSADPSVVPKDDIWIETPGANSPGAVMAGQGRSTGTTTYKFKVGLGSARYSLLLYGNFGVDSSSQTAAQINAAIAALDLGTASKADVADFATAAQGALADTAIQGPLASVAFTGLLSSLTDTLISSPPTAGDVLTWSGSRWVNSASAGGESGFANTLMLMGG